MNIKVTVNQKIVINGKEYGSPDELPDDLRRAYQRAMGSGLGAGGFVGRKSKIMFQGREYDSPASMPEEARRLYDLAMAAANLEKAQPGGEGGAAPAGPVERDGVFISVSSRNAEGPAAAGGPRDFSIKVNLGRGGVLVLLALLLGIFWYVLTTPGSVIR